MRLSKTTGHAIRILLRCAEGSGGLAKVADIAAELDITTDNVFKIVHLLSRAGFLEAVRGRHGGVRLKIPAAQIRVGAIIRAIEATDVAVAGLDDGQAPGSAAKQPLTMLFDDALEAFISVLNSQTLADMAKGAAGKTVGQKRAAPSLKMHKAKPRTSKASAVAGAIVRR